MNISLPEELRQFVDRQVASRGYSSSSEYLRALIRREREHEKLRQLLLDGAASPIIGEVDVAYFEALRERVCQRAAQRGTEPTAAVPKTPRQQSAEA